MQSIFSNHKRKGSENGERENLRKKGKRNGPPTSSDPVYAEGVESSSRHKDSIDSRHSKLAHKKISKLLAALEDVLDEHGKDEIRSVLGEEAFNQALNLQNTARKHLNRVDAPHLEPPDPASRLPQPTDSLNTPPTVTSLLPIAALGPWKSSLIPNKLPPLPPVLDPTLEAAAFIHQGYGSGRPTDLSYERLEWVGDAYIYLLSCLFISQTFPTHLPGKCSMIRERLVKNLTLSSYARQYGFVERAKLPESFSADSHVPAKDQDKTKVLGDIFEAYVAAVVISDPAYGVARASAWLKDLWGMTIKKEIVAEERDGLKIDSPMWKLRGDIGSGELAVPAQPIPPNPKEQLQKMVGSKGIKIEYKDAGPEKKDRETKLALFTVGVYLTGWGEKEKLLGTGTAHGKKDAGMKAAKMAIENKKAMAAYVEKKRLFDAQLELERKALEDQEQGGS